MFDRWFDALRDKRARARIQVRIDRLQLGNPGQVASIGDGISEMKIDYGPGYRVYFVRRGQSLILLLVGGDKHTQGADIRLAQRLLRALRAP